MDEAVPGEAVAMVRGWAQAGSDAGVAAATAAALGVADAFLGQAVLAREVAEPLVGTGGWQRLAARPVVRIDPPPDGAVDIDGDGVGWVRIAAGGRVTIRYRAGLAGEWGAVPSPVRQGVAALAAHLLTRPDADSAVPAAVGALWRPYRRMRLS